MVNPKKNKYKDHLKINSLEYSNYLLRIYTPHPCGPDVGPVPSKIGIVISHIESLFRSVIWAQFPQLRKLKTPFTSGVV